MVGFLDFSKKIYRYYYWKLDLFIYCDILQVIQSIWLFFKIYLQLYAFLINF